MALSIGVASGSQIDVGGHLLQIVEVLEPGLISLNVDSGPDIVVSENEWVTVLPGVKIRVGLGANGNNRRLAFEAPRAVKISRIAGPDEGLSG